MHFPPTKKARVEAAPHFATHDLEFVPFQVKLNNGTTFKFVEPFLVDIGDPEARAATDAPLRRVRHPFDDEDLQEAEVVTRPRSKTFVLC